jgi:hypothetical protein
MTGNPSVLTKTARATSSISWPVLLLAALAGCATTTVHVDANTQDTSSASALWLQADIPGKPFGNVYLNTMGDSSGDVSIEVGQNAVVTLTALATDNESGIRGLSLPAFLTTRAVGGSSGWTKLLELVPRNFGVTNGPATNPSDVPVSSRVTGTVDFGALSAPSASPLGIAADWVIVDVQAVAISGAPPASAQNAKTYTMTLWWKRAGTPPP